MQTPSVPLWSSAADVDIERLAARAHVPEEVKVAEAARQFEAILLRQIFRETMNSTLGPTLEGGSSTQKLYQGMVQEQLAEAVTRSGGVGLARSLQVELSRQSPSPASPVNVSPAATRPIAQP